MYKPPEKCDPISYKYFNIIGKIWMYPSPYFIQPCLNITLLNILSPLGTKPELESKEQQFRTSKTF